MTRPHDHRGADLRGRSFAGASLDGADFGGADLRGVDLSEASLRDASFVGATLGLRSSVKILLFAAALLIVVSTGWLIGWTARGLVDGITGDEWEVAFGRGLIALVIGAFILFVVLQGLVHALRSVAVILVIAIVIRYTVILTTDHGFDPLRDAQALAVMVLIGASLVAGGIARIVGGTLAPWSILLVGLAGGFAAGRAGGGVVGLVVSVVLVFLAKRTLTLDVRDRFARRLVHRIVSRRGTAFTGADLRGADFTDTYLDQCDLTDARLDGATLDRVRGFRPFAPEPGGPDATPSV